MSDPVPLLHYTTQHAGLRRPTMENVGSQFLSLRHVPPRYAGEPDTRRYKVPADPMGSSRQYRRKPRAMTTDARFEIALFSSFA
jgi:hypothetical protein